MKDERAHLELFDLIARDWTVPSPVRQISFNASDTAVAFACADGTVWMAATADKASPGQRLRRAVDTGRLTIAPRDKAFAPLKPADYTAGRSSDVVPFGESGFAFARDNGRINALTPGGIATYLPAKAPGPITALAATADGGTLAYACGAQVFVTEARADAPQALTAPGPVTALAVSPDGQTLAAAYEGGVVRWHLSALDAPACLSPLPGAPVRIVWRADGAFLLASMGAAGLCVIDAANNTVRSQGNFPAPVTAAAFGPTTGTVIAPGAFRVTAWTLDDWRDTQTGKAGLVLIPQIATSPNRNLVAVGYANGLLSLAEIGQPAEILLREDTGAGITAMAWSANGDFLAVAGEDGTVGLVEFPVGMFKS